MKRFNLSVLVTLVLIFVRVANAFAQMIPPPLCDRDLEMALISAASFGVADGWMTPLEGSTMSSYSISITEREQAQILAQELDDFLGGILDDYFYTAEGINKLLGEWSRFSQDPKNAYELVPDEFDTCDDDDIWPTGVAVEALPESISFELLPWAMIALLIGLVLRGFRVRGNLVT